MTRVSLVQSLVEEATNILSDLGIPMAELSPRRRTKIAKVLCALCDIKAPGSWRAAKSQTDKHALLSRDIIKYLNSHLGESIADSSYDDIRRKDLIYLVEGAIVIKAATNKNASTNDGTRRYAISDDVVNVIRQFNTALYSSEVAGFLGKKGSLREKLARDRELARQPVVLPDGTQIAFSVGDHNRLQKKIIEDFLPRFGYRSEVLYVGDTENKFLFINREKLKELGMFELAHDKLPDVVAYSIEKNWVFFIEAVHTSGPISEFRRLTLDQLTEQMNCGKVYVSAFLDRAKFRSFIKDIAWETEVWIAESPDHMIHFNGDKFLGPYR